MQSFEGLPMIYKFFSPEKCRRFYYINIYWTLNHLNHTSFSGWQFENQLPVPYLTWTLIYVNVCYLVFFVFILTVYTTYVPVCVVEIHFHFYIIILNAKISMESRKMTENIWLLWILQMKRERFIHSWFCGFHLSIYENRHRKSLSMFQCCFLFCFVFVAQMLSLFHVMIIWKMDFYEWNSTFSKSI